MTISMKRLGEVSKIIAGQSPPSSTYNQDGDGLPFYQGKIDFSEWFPKTRMWCSKPVKISEPGDVLISVRAPVGPTNLCQEISCIGRGLGAIRPNPGTLDSHYLIHFVRSSEKEIASMGRGSTFSAITRGDLEDIQIPIPHKNGKPDLDEQKRIAAILDKADAIRRKRQQALRLTDDFLRSVFLDLFGDPALNSKGWKVGALAEGVESFDGGWNIIPTETERPDGFKVLKVSAVTSGEYRPDESKHFAEQFSVPQDYLVRQGDLIISRANTAELVGAVAYVWDVGAPRMLPDKLWRFVWSQPQTIDPLFMLYMAKSKYFRDQLIQRASGSSGSMKNIGKAKMMEIPIPYPPLELQKRFASIVTHTRTVLNRAKTATTEAETLFQSLQHRAFTGQL